MSERLLSVGIDLGTSTTQMILSRLRVENQAAAFSVPRMEIVKREILYRGGIHITPLLSADTIDGGAIRQIIAKEYEKAQVRPEDIQTGAVIITGETARKENAEQVLQALRDFAGEFVVATAGPALESVLAAQGAGADRLAARLGQYVLHVDIGGGTSNLALFDPEGKLVDTGCVNVGGRLMRFDGDGRCIYRSPVLRVIREQEPEAVAKVLAELLEQAVGLRPKTALLERFVTDKLVQLPKAQPVLSFSGGVADLIQREEPDWLRYHDLGVLLGRAIRRSRLCAGAYHLGAETIRATVVGAGCHSTELSGSTVDWHNTQLPIHDLPVMRADGLNARQIRAGAARYGDRFPALALTGVRAPSFAQVEQLAQLLAEAAPQSGLVVILEADMAKALGQALRLRLGAEVPVLCLDGIAVPEGSYLDLAKPVGSGTAFPVVVKTLAFL